MTGVALVCASAHKQSLRWQRDTTTQDFGITLTGIPTSLADDPLAAKIYKETVTIVARTNEASTSILVKDIKRFLTNNPSIRDELTQNLVLFKSTQAVAEAKQKLSIEKANEIGLSLSARSSTDSEIIPSESFVVRAPSIIEKLFFEN